MKHPLGWFKVGKTVYRKPIKCHPSCGICQKTEIKITDEATAYNMEMMQYDLNIDYYDKPL